MENRKSYKSYIKEPIEEANNQGQELKKKKLRLNLIRKRQIRKTESFIEKGLKTTWNMAPHWYVKSQNHRIENCGVRISFQLF